MRGLWVGGLVWVWGATAAITLPQSVRSPLQFAQVSADSPQKREADRLLSQGIRQYSEANRLLSTQGYSGSQYREALQSLEAALQLYRDIKDYRGEANSLSGLGNVYNSLGQYQKAINSYQQSLVINQEIGDRYGEANSLSSLGKVYHSLGQYQKAINSYQQSLAIGRDVNTHYGAASSINLGWEHSSLELLGRAYASRGQYQKAINTFQEALAIMRKAGDHRAEVRLLVNSLAPLYHLVGQNQKTIDFFFQEALAIRRKIGDSAELFLLSNSLGYLYRSMGQAQEEVKVFQEAITFAREIGNHQQESNLLIRLGDTYRFLRQHQKAIDFFQKALVIDQGAGDRRREAISLGILGSYYRELGQYQEAIDFLQQALAIHREGRDRREEAKCFVNLSLAYFTLGQQQKGDSFYQQALATARKIDDFGAVFLLQELSSLYSSAGLQQKAIDCFQQALMIARNRNPHPDWEASSLEQLGTTYFKANRLPESESAFRDSLAIYEARQLDAGQDDWDRVSMLEKHQAPYLNLQKTLVALNKIPEALEIADRSRSRSLLSFLRSENQVTNKPLTTSEIQAIAQQQNGTIVHYSVVSNELYIWVVPTTGAIAFRKVPLPQSAGGVAQAAEELRNSAVTLRLMSLRGDDRQIASFANQFRGEGDQVVTSNPTDLRQGYDLLIKPIADLLPTELGSKLIIIPHRELAVIPFAALRDEEGKFLIDRYTLAFAPSVSVLAEAARRPKTSTGPALIVGNPNPMPDNLRPLPGSEKEAQAIAQTLNAKPLIGAQATESKVKEQIDQASLLHFATHGILPRTTAAGLDSWLALAPSGDEDGQLTISEIFDRNLKAQLAVLSACDTGRGAVSGEGVIGLARAFLKAGVPTVVASLWKVPDEPTALMMQIFYAERAAGKDAATALRVAMLKVKEQYPGPQNWAAFVAIGDTN